VILSTTGPPHLRLILSSADKCSAACAVSCTELIWSKALKGQCKVWAGGHGDKVLASLVKSGSSQVRSEAALELKPLVKGDLQKWAEVLVTPRPKSHKGKNGPGSGELLKGSGTSGAARTASGVGKAKAGSRTKNQGTAQTMVQKSVSGDGRSTGSKKNVQQQVQTGGQTAKKAKRA